VEEERFIDGNPLDEGEVQAELSLRPQTLQQYIGQQKVKEELAVYIQAARSRSEALDHVLLYGPPGLGKTTLAMVIANELEVGIKTTSGPAIERPGDLVALLNDLQAGDVLFIDEIHRLPRVVEEMLYSAMEDFKIDIMLETGPNARSVQIGLNPFTLIGATTRSGMLTKPMLARFGIQSRLEYYNVELLGMIIERSARVLGVPIYENAALEIARRSRGTPRIANALLRRVRDFAEIKGNGEIDLNIAKFALNSLNVDEYGLDDMDNKIMRVMIENFKGKPVGISALATSIGENAETLEEVYEPYLIQEGFIIRTPRGREVTEKAYRHLGISQPKNLGELF